ncbi:MAG: type II toxin-antitoxin system PemK/MazF family toxin [Deltaproteobacteria bacterium]|nr:type II toxin-antitoxin system PemK/MazF family toxin [Deltaproteobacteria bacterium]
MRRGDVFTARFDPRSGAEQKGTRPVVIVSHDGFNESPGWRSVIVVPLSTSLAQTSRGPTAVPIDAGEGGLRKRSVALCHQVTTLSRDKLGRRTGRLTQQGIARIDEGLRAALSIE